MISVLYPYYMLGLAPNQALWPMIFAPLILLIDFVWAAFWATVMVVALAETDHIGQHALLHYALWTTISGLVIAIGHDVILLWMGRHVDFLLEPQPWRILGATYVVPCTLLLLYHWLLAWQYLRLRVWQALINGLAFAFLAAPWTTLTAVNFGQGRLPMAGQRLLWACIAAAVGVVLILAIMTTVVRQTRAVQRIGWALLLTCLSAVLGLAAVTLWTSVVATPAVGIVGVSEAMGDVAFVVRGRAYTVRAGQTDVRSLGRIQGEVVAWAPNGRLLLVNQQSDGGKTMVSVVSADAAAAPLVVGAGFATLGAWSPDSASIVYVSPTESTAQIHIVGADGKGDRVLAEGYSPCFSPDGRRIVYSARAGGRWQVWTILPTGGDPIQLTTEGGEDPLWSPDGRFIAYVQNNRAHVMDADGANKRRLPADNAHVDVRPILVWARDGSRLAYVYVYPPESGRPTQLYLWDTAMPAIPLTGALPPLSTPVIPTTSGANRSGDFRPPFAWSSDGAWFGFIRRGDLWALNVRTGVEQRLAPAESFAWGGRPADLVVRPVPTYPPTPTPTPLPPAMVESPAVLVLDPRDPGVMLAGTENGVVRNAGSSGWFLTSAGINHPTRVRTLLFDPTDSRVVYAGTDGQRAIAGALYKSTDGGNRWAVTGLKDVDVYRIIMDVRQAKVLYAGTSRGVYVSYDGGVTWNQRNNGLKTTTVLAIAVDPSPTGSGRASPTASSTVLYAGTRQGEVYKSTSSGGEWRLVQSLNAPVTGITVYQRKTTTVFATTEDGLFSSSDGGETWVQVSGGIWKVRLDGLVIAAKENTLYAYGPTGVYVSHDGGTNWGPASTGLEGTQPSALVAHPTDASILYVGTSKGVFRTTNGGVTWSR